MTEEAWQEVKKSYRQRALSSVSKTFLFDTLHCFLIFSEVAGYRLVSKLISKSKFQNLTDAMSFDTIVVYETTP